MKRTRSALTVVGAAVLLVSAGLLTSCAGKPTYPKTHLAESLQAVFAEDHLQTTVRVIDHTVAVQVSYPNALSQEGLQLGPGPAFDEVARKLITSLHRVLLSTDAHIEFYVILLGDPKLPGAYLTMVRYLDDVKRANANMLDTPEYFSRTIWEINVVPPKTPVSLEQYITHDIRLEEFLSWQLARRIQGRLSEELEANGLAHVGRCSGEFRNGEFAFTLNVAPNTAETLDEQTMQEVFRTATGVIAKVLGNYKFEGFNSVRLIHPSSGRSFVLPKTSLKVFQ